MYYVFMYRRLGITSVCHPGSIKKTIVQPTKYKQQAMIVVKLRWFAITLGPSTIASQSQTNNQIFQLFSKHKKLPLMRMSDRLHVGSIRVLK
jgi:hypothetical protein